MPNLNRTPLLTTPSISSTASLPPTSSRRSSSRTIVDLVSHYDCARRAHPHELSVRDSFDRILDRGFTLNSLKHFRASWWVIVVLLGVTTAAVSVFVDFMIAFIFQWRVDHYSPCWWIITSMLGAFCAYVVCIPAPAALGSGIPQMKVILGGHDPNLGFLSVQTLCAKVIGITCALGGGMPVGKEGPFVHVSACLVSLLHKLPPFRQYEPEPTSFHNLLSMSVAAGVTATFGAPVGGILFSIEVTTTYFFVCNLWRCFVCATVCVIALRSLQSIWVVGLFHQTDLPRPSFHELPFFLVLGICCGIIAGLFVRLTKFVMVYLSKCNENSPLASCWDAGYTLAVAAIAASAGIVCAPLRHADRVMINSLFSTSQLPEEHNLCVGLILTKLVITTLALCCAIPCGVFTPTFVLGAAFGRLYGLAIQHLFPSVPITHHALYAVMGAAGVTAGVTRTVSVCMIVFELTGQIHHMPFLLLTVVASYGVSYFLSLSIFDLLMHQKRLLFLPHVRSDFIYRLTAQELMLPFPPFVILAADFNKAEAKEIASTTWPESPLPIVSATNTLQALYFAELDEIDSAPLSVPASSSASQVQFLFTMLGLKFIVVTDPARNGMPIGIITMQNFARESFYSR